MLLAGIMGWGIGDSVFLLGVCWFRRGWQGLCCMNGTFRAAAAQNCVCPCAPKPSPFPCTPHPEQQSLGSGRTSAGGGHGRDIAGAFDKTIRRATASNVMVEVCFASLSMKYVHDKHSRCRLSKGNKTSGIQQSSSDLSHWS